VPVPAHKAGSPINFHQGFLESCLLVTTGQCTFPTPLGPVLWVRVGLSPIRTEPHFGGITSGLPVTRSKLRIPLR
jgi:hypothetical protein